MDMYYTKVIFIGDEYNREYEYTTDMKYEPGSLVKENRTNTYAKVIESKYAYTTERNFYDNKITPLISNVREIQIKLNLNHLGNSAATSALATYVSIGTEDGVEDVISAAEIFHKIAVKVDEWVS